MAKAQLVKSENKLSVSHISGNHVINRQIIIHTINRSGYDKDLLFIFCSRIMDEDKISHIKKDRMYKG